MAIKIDDPRLSEGATVVYLQEIIDPTGAGGADATFRRATGFIQPGSINAADESVYVATEEGGSIKLSLEEITFPEDITTGLRGEHLRGELLPGEEL